MRFSLHDGPGIRTTVFLKGCPLACWWCHNPEGQEFGLSSACGTGARQMAGRRISVAEALQEIERDVLFFEESGGGVTISGGEPLSQPAFAEALLAACRAHRIHTALDTSGFAPRDAALRVSAHADLVLYDLKLLDSEAHEKYTGVPNGPILSNLEALVEAGRNVVVRVPLIPGINDTPEELGSLADLASRLGLRRIDLLPYHRIGSHKYSHLSMESRLGEVQPPPPGELSRFAGELGSRGFQVRIGG